MRIAFFVDRFPLLSETFVVAQATCLLDRGHDVEIHPAAPGADAGMHPDVERYRLLARTFYPPAIPRPWRARGASALRILARHFASGPGPCLRSLDVLRFGRRAASLALVHQVASLLPPRRYDVLHAHFGPSGLRALALRDTGAVAGRLVTTFHGHDVNLLPRAWGSDLYRDLFARGDLFTANTRFTADRARALGCPADRLVELPMGLDLAAFTPPPRRPEAGGPPRLLTVGRLVEKKGIEYGLRAVARVARRHPDLRYRIVGDGPLRDPLARLARELGLAGRVELLGALDAAAVRALYADSDVFLLPCVTAADGDQEGQGLVLQEAQAMELPVLSTLHNGIPEGVRDGETGFLVPERDVEALCTRLDRLLDEPELRASLGRAGRAFVESRYDNRALTDRLVGIYRTALQGVSVAESVTA